MTVMPAACLSTEGVCLQKEYVLVAEWGPLFKSRVIVLVFSPHFFCSALCHPPTPALLQCLTAIVINRWEPCISTHPFLHCMLIFYSRWSTWAD